jgi:manganese oxidase
MFFTTVALATALAASTRSASPIDCRQFPTPPSNAAAPNDNRERAGKLQDGVLTVHLVAGEAAWRPDGPKGCALSVHAFAEEGRPTQIPGPLIRVLAGTEVRVTMRNALPTTLWVRGLQDRALGNLDSIAIAAGATRDFHFVARTPGAWFYWGGGETTFAPVPNANGQLVGALVVDPANDSSRATTQDRVLVLTRWNGSGSARNEGFQLNAFNGRSWPNTERLVHTVGDSVFWKVINATNTTHEMHLHGFYFRLHGRGFAIDSSKPIRGLGEMRVTAVLRAAEWLAMSWSPDRPGNWLYHCHLLSHMSGAQRLGRSSDSRHHPAGHHAAGTAAATHTMDDMGGLVLGLEVRPREKMAAGPMREATPDRGRRALELFASERPRTFGERSGYGFVLQESPEPPARDSIRIPGTALLLTRGEPVRIAVHNRLDFPISVHWHGIELESYFDGVGGFSGAGPHVAPMIVPNDSFVVRFTPPRAGTFIYHVHGESGEELASGLYGALLVLDPATPFDPQADRVFVLADGGPGPMKPIFINGTATPDTIEMRVGTEYRLRFISIGANDVFLMTLTGPEGVATVRQVALDGHDFTAAAAVPRPMRQPAGPGHTMDFLFTPTVPGDYSLSAVRGGLGSESGTAIGPVTTVPLRVRAP